MPLISTARLHLLPAAQHMLRGDLESREAFAAEVGAIVPESWPPELHTPAAINSVLEWMDQRPMEHRWGTYYVIWRAGEGGRTVVGVGGYRGSPNAAGLVEIRCSILAPYRLQQFATEAMNGWIANAFEDAKVREVTAVAPGDAAEAVALLKRVGFLAQGSANDPSDPKATKYLLRRGRYEMLRDRPPT